MQRITGRRRWSALIGIEELESRTVPTVLVPAQVRHAYGFDQINFVVNGQTVRGDGSGQTIAIVNAFDNPTIFNDVDTFDRQFSIDGRTTLYQQYGAATKFLTRVNPQGQPAADRTGAWTLETALDVQWAHAIAPGASILLVQAKSDNFYDLMSAVNYARNQPGVVAVSMSWGTSEFVGQTSWDAYFTTPANHVGGSNGRGGPRLSGGVTFVGASGDYGAPAIWPATSSNVLAVGGTTLQVDALGNYLGEVAWSGSGGGRSTQVTEPSWQYSVQSTGRRTTPDVSYNADPNTSVYVYSSMPVGGRTGWFGVGGTSAAAPQWAALIAIVDQGRALNGKGSLDGPSQTLPALYAMSSGNFRDVIGGSNGFTAVKGYDLATGRGSPYADRVVRDLVAYAGAASGVTAKSTTTSVSSSVKVRAAIDVLFADRSLTTPDSRAVSILAQRAAEKQLPSLPLPSSLQPIGNERDLRRGSDPGPAPLVPGTSFDLQPTLSRLLQSEPAPLVGDEPPLPLPNEHEERVEEHRMRVRSHAMPIEDISALDACYIEPYERTEDGPDELTALWSLALVLTGSYQAARPMPRREKNAWQIP
ncbi:MAG: S53 family peptidase [Gemmataceae bacterium]|nr:S53 family peptidase [Gemmataceae bacterium]